jgi:hypothetical protein
MSSMLRHHVSLSQRTGYLLTVLGNTVDPSGSRLSSSNCCLFQVNSGTFGPSDQIQDISAADILTLVDLDVSAGALYKDLGRSLYVYETLGQGANLLCVFRQVLPVNGPATEGIPSASITQYSYYLKTWSSDGSGVIAVRTG